MIILKHFSQTGGSKSGAGSYDDAQFYRQGGHQQSSDFSGFEDLFGRFGSGFGGGNYQYQNQQRQQQRSYAGEDQHASIEVDIQVAYEGATQQITLQIPSLNAYGEPEVQRKTLQVKIPKGMKEGQHIRLAGQGQIGEWREKMAIFILKFIIKIQNRCESKVPIFMPLSL